MKRKTQKRYREKRKRWIKNAWKEMNRVKSNKPVEPKIEPVKLKIEPVKPKIKPVGSDVVKPKIRWFKRIIIYIKNKLKQLIIKIKK